LSQERRQGRVRAYAVCGMHTDPLPELIARINSSLRLEDVLDHAIAVCAQATACEGALMYLWDEEQGRLVVRAAVDGYKHWIGGFGLELGEGLTGWTALTRRVGVITEDVRSDPRYKAFPELNDLRFQSVLTIPVVGRADDLVGVLTLHTTAPHEFSRENVSTLETIATLIAGAVENARLHGQAVRAMKVFSSLADLSRQLALAAHAPGTLQRLALTALELLDAALVVVLRLDGAREHLVVETWVGREQRVGAASVPVAGAWGRLLAGSSASVVLAPDDPLVRGLGLSLEPRALFTAPCLLEGCANGLLCCFATERRELGEDNLALLATIANHTAIALERHAAEGQGEQRKLWALFDGLRAGELPHDAPAGLSEPHAVVYAERARTEESGWSELTRRLAARFPGTLADERATFAALVPVRSSTWAALLERTLAEAFGGPAIDAVAGFSDATAGLGDYGAAFRQARVACAVARASGPAGRVRAYASLGAQRYLWAISQERDPGPLEVALERLRELDRTRGSDLFRTLETYLEHQGNGQRTAAALYVHRNTLRQRLRRIGELLGVDPSDPAMRFDVQLAARLIRFRELGERNGGPYL
jgi:GAF domain-containing protein